MKHDLLDDVAGDDKDRIGEVKEEPELHRLDVGGWRQTGGHREVDRGQDHHAGDVDRVEQAVLVIRHDVVGGLIDGVHQDSREVGHHHDAPELPVELHTDLDPVPDDLFNAPALYDVLAKLWLTVVNDLSGVNVGEIAVSSCQVELQTADLISEGEEFNVVKQTSKLYPLLQHDGEIILFAVVDLTNVELVDLPVQYGLPHLRHEDLIREGADYGDLVIEFYFREPNLFAELLRQSIFIFLIFYKIKGHVLVAPLYSQCKVKIKD